MKSKKEVKEIKKDLLGLVYLGSIKHTESEVKKYVNAISKDIESTISETRQEVIEEIKKKIRARRRVLKELYKKYTLEIDEHRLDELYQLDKLLEDLNNK